ncbi:MAG: IMP dehydrogenase [Candidatus Woesearchaeota archaeon]|nr:IMP dehydrogenase [Candidatus Woesearchaeota archaeon]
MVRLHQDLEGREFTYSDILVLPGITNFEVKDVDMSTYLSKNIRINLPFLSSPMDTVTEHKMAIALALHGGVGVIHYNFYGAGVSNFAQNVERQKEELKKVKKFEGGFVEEPITLGPLSKVSDAERIRKKYDISNIPITEDGSSHGRLIGAVNSYCYHTRHDENKNIENVMLKLDEILYVKWGDIAGGENTPLEAANKILLSKKAGVLYITDDEGNLKYIVTRKDIDKNEEFPYASKDSKKRLMVGAAIESRREKAMQRLEAINSLIDFAVIDTSHAAIESIGKLIKEIKEKYRNLEVIVGNVSTADGARFLIENNADAIKVGTGSGSICTTIEVTGVGRQQGIAVYECSCIARKLQKKYGYVPVIADGGIKKHGDLLKALALGADSIMMGSMFAATEEAPGEIKEINGMKVKTYRGMGSLEAMMEGGAVRYGLDEIKERAPEGISKDIPYKGSVVPIIKQMKAALAQGMHKAGARTIKELHEKAHIAPANKEEAAPHILKESQTYNSLR